MKIKSLLSVLMLSVMMLSVVGCNNKKSNNQKASADKSTTVENVSLKTASKEQLVPFTFSPTPPTEGKLKGVVELGASGFNLFIIKLDKDKNWKTEKKEFGNSLIKEGMTGVADVKATLKDYIQTIVSFGVASKDIHFVVSSGAAKEEITNTITKALKQLGYVVNVVTPEQEAKFAFRSVMPKELENEAFVVDMGSGNTKISYMQDGKLVGKETFGSKYFQKEIENTAVADDVAEKLKDIPSTLTKTCLIIGGIPYQMAKIQRQGEERYTVLSTQLTKYEELVADKGQQASCGLNIYESILKTTNTKQMVFDWDANFTIGFLLGLPY